MLIPGLIVILVTLHALLIKRHRISTHPGLPAPAPDTPADLQPGVALPAARPSLVEVTTPPGETYLEAREPFTHHLRRVGAFGLVLLGLLSVVAVIFPPPVGPTPVAGVEVAKPTWPFWWMFTWRTGSGCLRSSGAGSSCSPCCSRPRSSTAAPSGHSAPVRLP
jgi:ubiquinol-cytochrome c reductase cytochrome b subunit